MPTAICLCTHPAVDQCGICYILHLSAMPTAMPIYQTLTHLFLAKESLPASVFCIISQVGLDNFSPCTCSRCSHSCYIILLIQASLVAVLTPHVCGVKLLFNVRTRCVVALNYKLNRHTYNRYTLYIHVYIEKSTAQLASVGLAQACPNHLAQQQMLCSLTHVT